MGETLKIAIKGMSCDHCVQTLTKGLGEATGVEKVVIDLKGQSATVQVKQASEDLKKQLFSKIEDLGYEMAA